MSAYDCWGLPQQPNTGLQPPSSMMTTETISALALPLPQPEDHTPQPAATVSELAELVLPLPQPKDHAPLTKHRGPIAHVDVFVNDFIGIVQGSQCWCQNVWQCIMHAVDNVFSQPDPTTAKHKEAISEKKLLKDGGWSQWKEILGWILDTSRGTLELTDWQKSRILAIFEDHHHKGQVGVKKWQQLLSELHFMGPAVPGASSLFGVLQLGLSHADKHCMCITLHLQHHLTDFEVLARSITQCPTHFMEIMPDYPSMIGSVDTAKPGMGGVLFAPRKPPAMWRVSFPVDIQCSIMSTNNTTGDLTNSDLEQAGVLTQADMATFLFDLQELTLATLNNNIAAISQNQKGSVTLDQAAAYLCHLSSLHHHHQCYHHEVSHITGEANTMASILS